jgi:hypothetical protein
MKSLTCRLQKFLENRQQRLSWRNEHCRFSNLSVFKSWGVFYVFKYFYVIFYIQKHMEEGGRGGLDHAKRYWLFFV